MQKKITPFSFFSFSRLIYKSSFCSLFLLPFSLVLLGEEDYSFNTRLSLGAEFVVMRALEGGRESAVFEKNGATYNPLAIGRYLTPQFSYEPGYNLFARAQLTSTSLLEASFLWIHKWSVKKNYSSPGALYLAPSLPSSLYDFQKADKVSLQFSSSYREAPLYWYYYLSEARSQNFSFCWILGASYNRIAQDLQLKYMRSSQISPYTIQTANLIYALEAGMGWQIAPISHFFCNLFLKAGLGYNHTTSGQYLADKQGREIFMRFKKTAPAYPFVGKAEVRLNWIVDDWFSLIGKAQFAYYNGIATCFGQLGKSIPHKPYIEHKQQQFLLGFSLGASIDF